MDFCRMIGIVIITPPPPQGDSLIPRAPAEGNNFVGLYHEDRCLRHGGEIREIALA